MMVASILSPDPLLQYNPRARRLLGVAAASAGVLALVLGVLPYWITSSLALRIPLGLIAALFATLSIAAAGLRWQLARPLVSLYPGFVRLRLGAAGPLDLPCDTVEACFLGQGPSELQATSGQPFVARHLVLRLAEKAVDYQAGPTNPHLAKWCGGYITIYGLWVEPLTIELANRINRALAAAHRRSDVAG